MLDIKVSAALMGFTQSEQRKILDAVYGGDTVSTERLSEAVKVVTQIIEDHEEVVEGYAGFPIDKELIQKNKERFKDDRNIGRVISQGGQSMVITGLKSDGRYQVVGKKGEKTAKAPEDIGLNMQREHIDIDDLHQQMVEGLKQARKNIGRDPNKPSCWDGYKAKGTKKKGGKEVPNCVKEEEQIDERYKGKHGQSSAEYKDDRSQGGKMISGDSKMSGAEYTHGRRVKAANPGSQPDEGGKTKPKSQGKMDKGTKADLAYRKANLKKEDFEAFVEEIILDEEFDTFSFEELHDICVEALEELDADVLTEALDIIDGMELLSEDYYDSAVKASKAASKTPAAKAGRANLRKEKMKAALKSAGSAVKKGLKTAGKAAAKGAGYAAGATVRAAKAGASEFKKGYDRGRGGSKGSSSTSTVSGDSTRSSSSGGSSSGGSGESRVRLRDRIKSGIKRVVGGAARAVSRGSRNLARRMSEERYSWRKEMGMDE
tara:strand:+ start:11136 stop:12599 length:1464 start_codon:yes stop_codon:yes gene_type:complete